MFQPHSEYILLMLQQRADAGTVRAIPINNVNVGDFFSTNRSWSGALGAVFMHIERSRLH